MVTTAAVLFKKDGYDTKGQRLLGRQAAGEGFLKGLVQHGAAETLYGFTSNQGEFQEFCQLIKPWVQGSRQVRWIPTTQPQLLSQVGALYRPDAIINDLVWQRRLTSQTAYGICGVTHTIASKETQRAIADLLIAPVQPWDALICTSQAVKTAINTLLSNWGEYLVQRLGATAKIPLLLPVIPLGVESAQFRAAGQDQRTRQHLREKLGIPPEDLVILFVGRLIFYAKAHPVPMYLAVEKAAQASPTPVHLVQAGWFEEQREDVAFREAAHVWCPSVKTHFVDARDPEFRLPIWSIGDIFVSLSDNIQETFGLTPIEAMAAGLPVVVSDWNGYQESVRQGIDGFKIPTLMPPPASSLDFAEEYLSGELNYSGYVGHTSVATAIDVPTCAEALATLLSNPELRQQMGRNGQQRVSTTYDWQVVIKSYEALWEEMNRLRQHSPESAPPQPAQPATPLTDSPFRIFGHYATHILADTLVLAVGSTARPAGLQQLTGNWISHFGSQRRVPLATLEAIINTVEAQGSLTVADILQRFPNESPAILRRSLVYLLKFDILRQQS